TANHDKRNGSGSPRYHGTSRQLADDGKLSGFGFLNRVAQVRFLSGPPDQKSWGFARLGENSDQTRTACPAHLRLEHAVAAERRAVGHARDVDVTRVNYNYQALLAA